MAKYLIQDSHEVAECLIILDAFVRAGAHYLTNADWGCEDDVHKAWITVEAASDTEARRMVPPVICTGQAGQVVPDHPRTDTRVP